MSSDTTLVTLIREQLNGDLQDLPVFNNVAVKLQQLLASRSFELDDIIELIGEDQSLSGRVLKVANSSYYAGLTQIATIKDAIIRLGAQEIANMAMLASQFEYYQSANEILNRTMQDLWRHALACAVGAKWLTRKAGFPGLAAESFMAGLLHDIGKLALLKVLDDLERSGAVPQRLTQQLVYTLLNELHAEVGYNLMKRWNFPEFYCEVASRHHDEWADTGNILLASVRLANLATHKTGRCVGPHEPEIALNDSLEARFLGLQELALEELTIVIEDADGIAA